MSDAWLAAGLSPMAAKLQSSSILAIAAEVRALVATGREVCNLTIGDFKPSEYPVPAALRDGCIAALNAGYTNYPPPNGLVELREAVVDLYRTHAGYEVDPEVVTIASGARPLLYAAYRAVVGPGDKVLYGVPSWNNNHFSRMLGGTPVEIEVGAEDNFFPTAAHLEPHLRDARLLVLNSPLNPSGTCIRPNVLRGLCETIVEENERRRGTDERPLYMLYDQIYWMLTLGDIAHADPIAVEPRMVDYAIVVDGVSKAFAATGMRVGWAVAPATVSRAMNHILGHVGAWAPHPMQRGAVALLRDAQAVDGYLQWIRQEARDRLAMIHDRLAPFEQSLGVRALKPEGAIYLSVKFALCGCRYRGQELQTPVDVRTFLLDAAGMAVVPFEAFGAQEAADWYRLAVGAVSREQLDAVLTRLVLALSELEPAPR